MLIWVFMFCISSSVGFRKHFKIVCKWVRIRKVDKLSIFLVKFIKDFDRRKLQVSGSQRAEQILQDDRHEKYSAWQRLTKRQAEMINPALREKIFHRILKKSLHSNFFVWPTLPKRRLVQNTGYNANMDWQRSVKRQDETSTTNVQNKSQHSNWIKQGCHWLNYDLTNPQNVKI